MKRLQKLDYKSMQDYDALGKLKGSLGAWLSTNTLYRGFVDSERRLTNKEPRPDFAMPILRHDQ